MNMLFCNNVGFFSLRKLKKEKKKLIKKKPLRIIVLQKEEYLLCTSLQYAFVYKNIISPGKMCNDPNHKKGEIF